MPTTREIDQLLAIVFAALAALYLLRAGLGVTLYAAGVIPGRIGRRCRSLSARVTPRLLRRVGGAILSASAVGGLMGVAPAMATGLDRGPISGSQPTATTPNSRGGPPPAASSTTADRRATEARAVVVQPGDCLWNIAARQLPANASSAEIDHLWRRWYERNRVLIGSDPDLIATGSRLLAPR